MLERTSGDSPGPGGTPSASDHRHEVKRAQQGTPPAPDVETQWVSVGSSRCGSRPYPAPRKQWRPQHAQVPWTVAWRSKPWSRRGVLLLACREANPRSCSSPQGPLLGRSDLMRWSLQDISASALLLPSPAFPSDPSGLRDSAAETSVLQLPL